MTTHPYSEEHLVEQPAIELFAALGWQTVATLEETFGPGGTLGRATRGEVVLVNRLHAALVRFNPTLPPAAIDAAIDELTRRAISVRSAASSRGPSAARHASQTCVSGKIRSGQTRLSRSRSFLHPLSCCRPNLKYAAVTAQKRSCCRACPRRAGAPRPIVPAPPARTRRPAGRRPG